MWVWGNFFVNVTFHEDFVGNNKISNLKFWDSDSHHD